MGATFMAFISVGHAQEKTDQKALDAPIHKVEIEQVTLAGILHTQSTRDGFFFFKNNSEAPKTSNFGKPDEEELSWSLKEDTSFTSRSGVFLKDFGETNGAITPPSLSGFTPRNVDAKLVLSYGHADRDRGSKSKSLDFTLASQVSSQGADEITGVSGLTIGEGNNTPSYNVGLSVDYSGFNLDASFKQGAWSDLNYIRGLDFGLGFKANLWSTQLIFGDYSQKNSHLGRAYGPSVVNFYALEFGAAYRLGSVFRLRGGVRYFNFYDRIGADPFGLSVKNKQVFYLGTDINF
jgi:hypothetical protein